MKLIDCKGMLCPMPVINTKKYFDTIEEGEAKVIVDNEVSKDNIYKYALGCGYKVDFLEENDLFVINIKKNSNNKNILNIEKDYALIISSNLLGEGDSDLGEILMKGYIYTLSESDIIPKKLIFINSGVKLTVKGSVVLESLNKLINRGIEVLCCGTCLDFYGIKDKLEVGSITNMYTIVEIMNSYNKVVKL